MYINTTNREWQLEYKTYQSTSKVTQMHTRHVCKNSYSVCLKKDTTVIKDFFLTAECFFFANFLV